MTVIAPARLPYRRAASVRPGRVAVTWFALGLATTTGQALPADVALAGRVATEGEEYVLRVENRDHETSSFQWFIDEQPVTAATVARAGELVFFARPATVATYRVVVTTANGAESMGILRLDPAAWSGGGAPAAPGRVQITRLVR